MSNTETTRDITMRILAAYDDFLPEDVTDALSSAFSRLRRLDSDLKLIASDSVRTLEFAKSIAGEVP